MTVLVTCSGCGAEVELPPAPDKPGFVLLRALRGWTVPPPLCPDCQQELGGEG